MVETASRNHGRSNSGGSDGNRRGGRGCPAWFCVTGTKLHYRDAAADATKIFKISKYISYIWTRDDTMWSPRELTHAINIESPSYVGIFILIIQ